MKYVLFISLFLSQVAFADEVADVRDELCESIRQLTHASNILAKQTKMAKTVKVYNKVQVYLANEAGEKASGKVSRLSSKYKELSNTKDDLSLKDCGAKYQWGLTEDFSE